MVPDRDHFELVDYRSGRGARTTASSLDRGYENEDGDDDEYTSLCARTRVRRYGTTKTLSSSTLPSGRLVEHRVQDSDTLQGLSLRYNCPVAEIKQLNRLWSYESLHHKTSIFVRVPVDFEEEAATTQQDGDDDPEKTAATSNKAPSPSEKSSSSISDILKRIDATTARTSDFVKKRSETLDHLHSLDGSFSPSSSSSFSSHQSSDQKKSRRPRQQHPSDGISPSLDQHQHHNHTSLDLYASYQDS